MYRRRLTNYCLRLLFQRKGMLLCPLLRKGSEPGVSRRYGDKTGRGEVGSLAFCLTPPAIGTTRWNPNGDGDGCSSKTRELFRLGRKKEIERCAHSSARNTWLGQKCPPNCGPFKEAEKREEKVFLRTYKGIIKALALLSRRPLLSIRLYMAFVRSFNGFEHFPSRQIRHHSAADADAGKSVRGASFQRSVLRFWMKDNKRMLRTTIEIFSYVLQ